MAKAKMKKYDYEVDTHIQVEGLVGILKMKVVTTGTYKQDSNIEVSFTARLKLDECVAMDGENEKTWHASVLELYQKGRNR